MTRAAVLAVITEQIQTLKLPHAARVAIDGVDAAGKTILADELAAILRASGRDVVRASVDGFHNPAVHRVARGPDSPEGYYQDSFDYSAMIRNLLEPLGPGGSGLYREAVYDYQNDRPANAPLQQAGPDAILLVDGVFLLRSELRSHWDYSVFLHVDFGVALNRAERRDEPYFDSLEALRRKYALRYIPGQRLYLDECRPAEHASIVVDNSNLSAPRILAGR